MIECTVSGKTLPEAYHDALAALDKYGELCGCSDYNTTQKECSMTMVVTSPLMEPRISKLCLCYPEALEQYKLEMLEGIFDFEIAKGNWDYTYHDRITNYEIVPGLGKNQIKFVIDELKRNAESRRAVIDVRCNKDDIYSEDPACLQHIQYFIRNGKLECKVLFRSNDATRATFMNAFALIELQKKIAAELGVEVGTYTHRANSFHCYEAEFDTLNHYVTAVATKPLDKLTYNYEGEWEELMLDSHPAIESKIRQLQQKEY